MKILFIDTTTSDIAVAVIKDNEIYNVSQRDAGVKHSQTLCGKVSEVLELSKIGFDDLDAYACAVGPGSFTGIRIGISTLKGYCTAKERPYVEMNSLEAIACSQNCGNMGCSVIDAGNGYYYYDKLNGISKTVVPYDDERVKNCGRAGGACDYIDGALKLVREKYNRGEFVCSLAPVYIRRSQAEIALENKVSKNG